MKQLQPPLYVNPSSIHLSLNDLEMIRDYMREISQQIIIRDDSHAYDSFDEVREARGADIRTLRIATPQSEICFDFRRYLPVVLLWTSTSEPKVAAAYFRIKELLDARKSLFSRLLPSFTTSLLISAAAMFMATMGIIPSLPSRFPIYAHVAWTMPVVLLPLLSLVAHQGMLSTISLRRRHEAGSFFVRKKDDILLSLVSAIIGAVVALAFAKWTT